MLCYLCNIVNILFHDGKNKTRRVDCKHSVPQCTHLFYLYPEYAIYYIRTYNKSVGMKNVKIKSTTDTRTNYLSLARITEGNNYFVLYCGYKCKIL